jgi:hypothetical protein
MGSFGDHYGYRLPVLYWTMVRGWVQTPKTPNSKADDDEEKL